MLAFLHEKTREQRESGFEAAHVRGRRVQFRQHAVEVLFVMETLLVFILLWM